ncbi:hypothetical protein U0035_21655 [Niabella yanshanensis]|uniref:Lipoprotein n=1 Tax=Niabella yanshanensis TaxID=577386 RepID=A0ABZ0W591_9BACT|nr:hypothetical protein [Niabella yanshanensis]WQD38281.1 hypothetical protein U0035_21655 [Niabella yanshanensis]
MKLNNTIIILVAAFIFSLSACKAVKENFGGGVDMSQQDQVNKIPGIIAKKIQPEEQLLEVDFDFKNSQSFTQEAKIVEVVKAEGLKAIKISLNTEDSVGSKSMEEFTWYKDMVRYAKPLSQFDFSKIAQYVTDAIQQIDATNYEYAGLGNYTLKVEKGGIGHQFDIQTTKKGESSKQNGRMITTNYYELNFEVTPEGKLINKSK